MRPTPVASFQRIETLDVLRGFALLGILAMNIRVMAAPMGAYLYPLNLWEYDGANRAAYLLTATLFDLKMMGLFSMLFGAGVLLYAAKADAGIRTLWFRRMAILLVVGLVHAYLIWPGDILVFYALCGMLVLWWMRRFSYRVLFGAGVAVLLVGALLTAGHGLSWDSMSVEDRAADAALMAPSDADVRAELARMQGSYADVVSTRAPVVFMFQTFMFAVFFFWRATGMMLIGMALYKSGFLDGTRPTSTYATTALICLPVGLGLAAYGALALDRAAYALPARILLDLWNYVGSVFASIGYAAAIIFVVKRLAAGRLRGALAAVGQMALTNYLLHSIVTAVIFLGWGFGLAGRFDYAEQLAIVAAICAAQLALSPLWLARYRFGPFEWLWRSLTYGRRQPMRRDRPYANVGSAPASV
jgi:uncharacterized protein